jgi:hypothetical protein
MATAMEIKNFSTAVAWKPLALEALNGPPPLVALMHRSWIWAGGLVLGGYWEADARPSLRLGARYGLPVGLLGAAWGAAYLGAFTALRVLLSGVAGMRPVKHLPL